MFLQAMFARGPSFFASRRTGVAWAVFAALMAGFGFLALQSVRPASVNPLLLLPFAASFWLLMAWLLWKYGALVLAAVAALVVWGFRNALDR